MRIALRRSLLDNEYMFACFFFLFFFVCLFVCFFIGVDKITFGHREESERFER